MSFEKMPPQSLEVRKEYPMSLQNAIGLLADRNGIQRILREGDYRPIANRITTFVRELQTFREVEPLPSEDIQTIQAGIRSILEMPACAKAERPYLVRTIQEQFKKKDISPIYLQGFDFPIEE